MRISPSCYALHPFYCISNYHFCTCFICPFRSTLLVSLSFCCLNRLKRRNCCKKWLLPARKNRSNWASKPINSTAPQLVDYVLWYLKFDSVILRLGWKIQRTLPRRRERESDRKRILLKFLCVNFDIGMKCGTERNVNAFHKHFKLRDCMEWREKKMGCTLHKLRNFWIRSLKLIQLFSHLRIANTAT